MTEAMRPLVTLGLVTALCMWTGASIADTAKDQGTIRISKGSLSPERFETDTGDRISWTYEDEGHVILSFPEDFRESLTCDGDLRPELYASGDGRILSLPIGKRIYALPCPLAPGTYSYRAHLIGTRAIVGQVKPAPGVIQNPDRTHQGTVVVR